MFTHKAIDAIKDLKVAVWENLPPGHPPGDEGSPYQEVRRQYLATGAAQAWVLRIQLSEHKYQPMVDTARPEG